MKRTDTILLAVLVICLSAGASAAPTLKWTYKAKSTLYAPPLVADVHPEPGCETIISDADVRVLRCIDARGTQIWEYKGGWTRRLTSSAALSTTARPGRSTLLIGGSDGMLVCLDAATGTRLWEERVGTIEWGAAIWADIDGDGRDEAIAGTGTNGVCAFNADGTKRWTYRRHQGERNLVIRCPIATADVDADGKDEIFGAEHWGTFCLNGDGTLRWNQLTGDDFVSTVTVADADHNGAPELYACSHDDDATFCFDARTGAVKWKAAMLGPADVYPSSSIAVGDIDRDGYDEIIVADALGSVYRFTHAGELVWIFETEKRTYAAPSLGDVDGDGEIEVIVTCGDHYLYCIDADGRLEWRYAADLRLMYPATIADVDNDGKTDILFCGSDKTLRCLTLDGRHRPGLLPWPSRRFDAAQSGSSFGKRVPTARTVVESRSLLADGGFEQGKVTADAKEYPKDGALLDQRARQPRGWNALSTDARSFALDTTVAHSGDASVKTVAGETPFVFVSDPIAVDRDLESVRASIYAKGGTPKARLQWVGLSGLLREDPFEQTGESEGWMRFETSERTPPREARSLYLVCETAPGQTTWWDAAEVEGRFAHDRVLRALVNQVGYDVGAPKRFTARSTFRAQSATFELITEDGSAAFSAPLQHAGRIQGAYGHDWGYEYWRGDFTDFDTPGTYSVNITLDAETDVSWPFEIADNVLWDKTAVPAYRFFYYQRCGMAVPGFHGACHLDDAASPDGKTQHELWGGWHDAGDYNTYHNAPYVLGLARAYGLRKEVFDRYDEDNNGVADFRDEIMWGGEHSRRMIAPDGSAFGTITSGYGFWGPPELETDNIPGTGDERRIRGNETGNDSANHLAAMAKIAAFVDDKTPWIEAAERALKWALDNDKRGPVQFSAALDLYVATKDTEYATLAKDLFPGVSPDVVHAVRLYDSLFGEDHSAELCEKLVAKTEEILRLADNPFGLYTHGTKEHPNFFGTPTDTGGWHVGNSSYVLSAANTVAMAYQYNPDPRYLAFVYDQFNWILGNNPYDISLMEGCGSAFPPTYHHRYAFSGVPRGAVPGSVVNGITWRAAGDDRPHVDMRGLDIPDFEPNEVWLPHNTNYLNALANLEAAKEPNTPPSEANE